VWVYDQLVENGEKRMGRYPRPSSGPSRVTTLELFFDLVFVFTITQITKLVEG
jgi:low temperature requirement protein LtrA